MRPRKTDRKLESFKIFPYVAWGLILIFVFFVYRLTVSLSEATKRLDEATTRLELKANSSLKDLEQGSFEQ